MALDVAEFLWSEFSNSLEEAESEFSGSISISYFKSIKNLISHFKAIKNVVKQIDIMPHPSLSETIDFLYDLNDALAEFRMFTHECKELNKQLLIFNPFTYYFIRNMKSKLKAMKKELESLSTQKEGNDTTRYYSPGKSQPVNSSTVFGFDEYVEKAEALLFGGGYSHNEFTAIGVVGIAGVGKTTLVQKVLEREAVKDHFDPIIWLPFSIMREDQQQFSRFGFETCILDGLGNMLDWKIVGLSKLLDRLNQLLSGKRYLIVLDDVQRRHINIEDRLWRGLPKGSGGTVIVTSRLAEVAQKLVDQKNLIPVKPLDREICWSIFEETIKKETLSMSHWETLRRIKEEIKDQCHGLPFAAKALAEIIPEQIREIESQRFLEEMYIPDELLKPDLDVKPAVNIPNCPVLVFVDMKDEQLGEKLYSEFCYRLNKKQVFAVLEEHSDSKKKVDVEDPESVLNKVYDTLQQLKSKKYDFAEDIQKRMRIIIVGGDAVTNWILGVICDLKLPDSPSIVPIPQGTESNIPLSFGWKEIKADRQSVTSFLHQVKEAQQIKTNSWHILIKMKATQSSPAQGIPPSSHLLRPVDFTETADNLKFSGGFWSYFSLGLDAPRSHGAYCFRPTARTLNSFTKVEVMKHGQWELLKVPSGIKSIICLNLPSESNPRGLSNKKKDQKNLIIPASVIDDGHLEIVGLKDGFLAQDERIDLAQVQRIRFEIMEGAAELVDIRIDGNPWKSIPDGRIIDIEIMWHSKVNILAYGDWPEKGSVHQSSQPSASGTDDNNNAKENSTDDNNNAKDKSKPNLKFGSTSTFRINDTREEKD